MNPHYIQHYLKLKASGIMPKKVVKDVVPVGKYGRDNRPSRRKRRSYHPPGSKTVVIPVVIEEIPDNVPYTVDGDKNNDNIDFVNDNNADKDDVDSVPLAASAKKLKPIAVPEVVDDTPECNVFMNTSLVKQFFEKLARCPECGETIPFNHNIKMKKGLAHFFKATCTSEICDWYDVMSSSKSVESVERGAKSYEINVRSCIAFREIGRGFKNMESFMKVMNSPPPMDSKTYRKIYDKLHGAYTESAKESMKFAAEEINVIPDEDGVKDVRASFDGSWQRRGFSSMNGTVACISEGKVVDYDVLTKTCHQCRYWKKTIIS